VIELRRGDHVLVLGHRGAAALAPPNSLASLRVAAEAGADGVEIDVLRAAGGELVLAHGPRVPADAPSLGESLGLAADLGLLVQLDVKLTGAAAEIARAVRETGLEERAFASSFSMQALAELREAASWLPRSYTYPGRPMSAWLRPLLPARLLPWLEAVGASATTLKTTVITRPVVATCHRAGIAVHAWTVNDPRAARALVERGVDAIITDDPRSVPGGMTDT
jgi:glycerophosphoryl diester phosphodiesterase